jgi:predicted RNA-binding Zn-ribbon protein involved in translation (DUF1610 family)
MNVMTCKRCGEANKASFSSFQCTNCGQVTPLREAKKVKFQKVYYDTNFSGCLPAIIIDNSGLWGKGEWSNLSSPPSSATTLKIKLTKNVGAYKKGEIFELWTLHVIPRNKVIGKYKNRIAAYSLKDYYKGENI